jgi:DNA uptake protein ComE-like DNA-binding protein
MRTRFTLAILAALLIAPIACINANAATPAPAASAPAAAPAKPPAAAPAKPASAATACSMVNVNAASVDDLDTLPGIGPSRANDIIKNRPYIYKNDLMKKAGLPQGVFDGLKKCAALVDVNNTSAADMQSVLDGVGDARAAAIVKGRPYKNPAEIVAKAGIPPATFDKFADELVAGPFKKK